MVKENANCVCCGGSQLRLVLDLGVQPLANSYHKKGQDLIGYPLRLNLCNFCFHLQLSHIVDPDLLFKEYLYVSGTSKTMHRHFDWFSDFVIEYCNPKDVLDIACNDGSQLDYFRSKGVKTFGIDPAENLYSLSSQDHKIVCDYFRKGIYSKKFDCIIAQNVFAHVEDPLSFLEACHDILGEDSYLFIQTSQANMVLENQFDTIYHEHISFFNINSMNELVKRSGMYLVDVLKTPIHGISYIFVISKKDVGRKRIENLIEVERCQGLLSQSTYDEYVRAIDKLKTEFIETISEFKSGGYKLIGYGAAAKGMTLLNYTNVELDFIIDDNELKQGLYTPGTNIEIVPIERLNKLKPTDRVLFIPLAWNYFDEIKQRISKVRNNHNDAFLKYFPEVVVV